MISIVSVNWNAYDFARLLIASVKKFGKNNEIIIVDNSENKEYLPCKVISQDANIGHGEGINIGIKNSTGNYVLVLDIDCHIMSESWENLFLDYINNADFIAVKGNEIKPIRPACMFMKREFGLDHDFNTTANYKGNRVTPTGKDVGILAYMQMIRQERKIKFLETSKSKYGTLNGEEYKINRTSLVYHHWHGSHLKLRQIDYKEDLESDKRKLFTRLNWSYVKY